MECSAFVQPSLSSAFTQTRAHRAFVSQRPTPATPARIVMADEEKKPFFRNPFAAKPKPPSETASTFMAPQPGDPGYKEPAPTTSASPQKLPVVSGDQAKRGLDLLKEDILKNAPERAGVGRQDTGTVIMRPQAGEPGYKPAAYQTVKVSTLGISTFSDDKNYVGKVGGLNAVKQAAVDINTGKKTGKEIKKEVLKKTQGGPTQEGPTQVEPPTVYEVPDYLKPIQTENGDTAKTGNVAMKTDASKVNEDLLPDYLKPIPEDTPRKGMTWKNY